MATLIPVIYVGLIQVWRSKYNNEIKHVFIGIILNLDLTFCKDRSK